MEHYNQYTNGLYQKSGQSERRIQMYDYEKPYLEIIELENDVITASGDDPGCPNDSAIPETTSCGMQK